MISIGAGEELVSEYRSVIFYHVGKPEWVETIKVIHQMSRIKQGMSTNIEPVVAHDVKSKFFVFLPGIWYSVVLEMRSDSSLKYFFKAH